jgi:uncharacterized protein YjbI with pentapeptide repeats
LHVLKRWAAWPRGNRWLAGIAAVVLGLAIAWVLFVPVADWLAHHDVGAVKGPLHETALDNARGRLLTLGAAVFAAGALVFTARNFTLSRRTLNLTEQGQVTERYTKAIEQLGSDKLDVRIGGIYALERVARDSARDHPVVMEVLTAFIREHSREPWPLPDSGERQQERLTRPDVRAALTVVLRRDRERDIRRIDLTRADLRHADLRFADLADAELMAADLTAANLTTANLVHANLAGADLTTANLAHANLAHATLIYAHLARAMLIDTNLTHANLAYAHLTRAMLIDAHLTGAEFTGAELTGANWPEDAPVPDGWKLDAGSGRLLAADTGTETAAAN